MARVQLEGTGKAEKTLESYLHKGSFTPLWQCKGRVSYRCTHFKVYEQKHCNRSRVKGPSCGIRLRITLILIYSSTGTMTRGKRSSVHESERFTPAKDLSQGLLQVVEEANSSMKVKGFSSV